MTTMKRVLWLLYSLTIKGLEFGSRAFHVFRELYSLLFTKCTARLNTKISLFRTHSIFTGRIYGKEKILEFKKKQHQIVVSGELALEDVMDLL
jgi:hypothetical protein